MGSLPHDRSHLLIQPGGSEAPTELFRKSITRWLIAHLSDDLASDEGSGGVVESMAYSKGEGVVCGKVPIDVLIEDFFPSCKINWFVGWG